jgi:hypothetical protein
MVRFYAIFPKLFSMLIAIVDAYAMYFWYQNMEPDELYGVTGSLILWVIFAIWIIGVGLGCIWFGEYISEWIEQASDWGPTWLVKFVGWLFLLIPAVILLYCKVLR